MNRQPFVNGWLLWALSILALCITAPLGMGDAVTWAAWIACVLLVIGARAYQYFIQRR